LREWVFPQVKKLIEAAAKGGVPEASMLPFMKAGGRAVKLMLTRQQYLKDGSLF
jgi:cobalamin biosynthesis Co2+ chelatase CbiK